MNLADQVQEVEKDRAGLALASMALRDLIAFYEATVNQLRRDLREALA